ncbi:MAG: hypothetical protein RLZZ244_2616 [Verrucomicrobiota bacterium]|jgi:hypothetical protein
MQKKKIIVMGFMAGCPIAGVVWQHIHYIVGLQRLGHEVYYIEDSARLPYDPVAYEVNEGYQYAASILDKLSREFGFEGRWAFCARYLKKPEAAGLSLEKIRQLYKEADAILNVCGAQEMNEDLLQSERILYVESDPGVEQMRIDNDQGKIPEFIHQHHRLFTFGELVGSSQFPVPTHGLQWLPTRQPIVTDFWKTDAPIRPNARFTSVANWNTSGRKDVVWRGSNYLWSKSLEFLKFVEAPTRAGESFELATEIQDAHALQKFESNRWVFTDPNPLSIDYNLYRQYLQTSKGEFTVAKDQYVRLLTGWFSDRTACYLACGRPAITQQTQFTQLYGGQKGLLAFESLDDIAAAVESINADYAGHCKAAYEIAAEYFEATKVLASLLDRAGI